MKSEAELEKKGKVCVGTSVDDEPVEDESRQATPRRSQVGAKAPILGDNIIIIIIVLGAGVECGKSRGL